MLSLRSSVLRPHPTPSARLGISVSPYTLGPPIKGLRRRVSPVPLPTFSPCRSPYPGGVPRCIPGSSRGLLPSPNRLRLGLPTFRLCNLTRQQDSLYGTARRSAPVVSWHLPVGSGSVASLRRRDFARRRTPPSELPGLCSGRTRSNLRHPSTPRLVGPLIERRALAPEGRPASSEDRTSLTCASGSDLSGHASP